MQIDKTTLHDLSFFSSGEENIFNLIDFTVTQPGKESLHRQMLFPPSDFKTLLLTQEVIKFFYDHDEHWPSVITNGTLVMLHQFFESADQNAAPTAGLSHVFGSFFQKMLNKGEYSFKKFSLAHLSDFMKGCEQLTRYLDQSLPDLLQKHLEEIKKQIGLFPVIQEIMEAGEQTSYHQVMQLSFRARRDLKNVTLRLIQIFAQLDAWRAMAIATKHNGWVFPSLTDSYPIRIQAHSLHHPLLKQPVSYNISFDEKNNFLMLTGANMSGKSTFMRTLGVSTLLAHLGMGVPAKEYSTSFLHGIITNMHVQDNLVTGESYFFAEVQRMKQTALQILQPAPHLVLMDELFKGTNVHDAYECTRAIVKGLLNHPNHIMVLSTHLYEVAVQFKGLKEIQFLYFETELSSAGDYDFTYKLKPGISNDRIGYLILQKEGVMELLNRPGNR